MPMHRAVWPVGVSIFGVGLFCGVLQVVLIRQLLLVCSGSELTVGVILAVWLLIGGLGSLWGGTAARRDTHMGVTARRCVFLGFIALFSSVIAIALIRVSPELFEKLPPLFALQRGELPDLPHVIALTLVATAPAAFAILALFGNAISIYGHLRQTPQAMAHCYAIDALGHLIGGGSAAYLLTSTLDAFTTISAVASLTLLTTLWLWIRLAAETQAMPRAVVWKSAGLLLIAVGVTALSPAIDARTLHVRWRGYEVVANVETLQSNIVVVKYGDHGRAMFINGQPSIYTDHLPSSEMLVHFAMLQHPNPRKVLVIGGLGHGVVEEVLKYEVEQIDYFELDPGLLQVYEEHLHGVIDERVNVWTHDVRAEITRQQRQGLNAWDVVLIASGAPSTALSNRFYTEDFFRKLYIAAPGAVVGVELPGTQTYYSADLLRLNATLMRALSTGGRDTVIMPGYSLYVAAVPSGLATCATAECLIERLAERGVNAPYLESVVYDTLEPMNLDFVREQLAGYPTGPENTDLRPIGYFLTQVYNARQLHPKGARILHAATEISWETLRNAVIGLVVMYVVLTAFVRRSRRYAVPAAVAGTGIAGMVLQLGIVYAFQVHVGHIYSLIGVLSGAFMVGIAGGGLAGGRLLANGEENGGGGIRVWLATRWLAIALGLLAGCSLLFTGLIDAIVTHLVSGWAQSLGFFGLSLLTGALVGVQFPLATSAVSAGENQGPVAAAMYAADLFGASIGALLAGAIIVPLYGIGGAAGLCAIVSAGLIPACLMRRFR